MLRTFSAFQSHAKPFCGRLQDPLVRLTISQSRPPSEFILVLITDSVSDTFDLVDRVCCLAFYFTFSASNNIRDLISRLFMEAVDSCISLIDLTALRLACGPGRHE